MEIKEWLEDKGDKLLRWNRGTVVIESYYAKEFQSLCGDLDKLVACFEDNCEMGGAIEDYFKP